MQYEQSIVDLHDFFVGWFTGKLEQTAFQQFEDALATDYSMAVNNGMMLSRADVIESIRSGYGERDDFRIWITDVVVRHEYANTAIVTYYEWQQVGETTTRRTSTVIFRVDTDAPHSLRWLHVHESGLQEIDA